MTNKLSTTTKKEPTKITRKFQHCAHARHVSVLYACVLSFFLCMYISLFRFQEHIVYAPQLLTHPFVKVRGRKGERDGEEVVMCLFHLSLVMVYITGTESVLISVLISGSVTKMIFRLSKHVPFP